MLERFAGRLVRTAATDRERVPHDGTLIILTRDRFAEDTRKENEHQRDCRDRAIGIRSFRAGGL